MAKGGKRYGPKLKDPKIKSSKEHRGCGPIGYKTRLEKLGKRFTTRENALSDRNHINKSKSS